MDGIWIYEDTGWESGRRWWMHSHGDGDEERGSIIHARITTDPKPKATKTSRVSGKSCHDRQSTFRQALVDHQPTSADRHWWISNRKRCRLRSWIITTSRPTHPQSGRKDFYTLLFCRDSQKVVTRLYSRPEIPLCLLRDSLPTSSLTSCKNSIPYWCPRPAD